VIYPSNKIKLALSKSGVTIEKYITELKSRRRYMDRFLISRIISAPILGFLSMLLSLLLVINVWGQEIIWSRTYGGSASDVSWRVCQTQDGGYIMIGDTESYGNWKQIYLIKTDSRGDTLWTRNYGGYGLEQGLSVQQTADGGYVLSGTTTSFGFAFQAYLIKTNSRGDTVWTRTYGGSDWENASSVRQTIDGGYIIAGWTYTYGAGGADVYLIKTDSRGRVRWTKTYGGSRDDFGWWVEQTSDGGYIICGTTRSFGIPQYNVYLIKTDSEGDTLWTKIYYPWYSYQNEGFCCQQTEDGGYIVSGFTIDQGTGKMGIYLIKTDAQGDTLWTRIYGTGDYVVGFSVRQTFDGGYIVAGIIDTGSGNDIYVVKTDSEGDTLWTRNFGGIGAIDVQQISDSNYILLGRATDQYGHGDFYLLKISSSPLPNLRGDATGDGVINVSDVIYLINCLYRDAPTPEPLKAGDANCDLWIDIQDVIYLINYLFYGGPEPGYGCE